MSQSLQATATPEGPVAVILRALAAIWRVLIRAYWLFCLVIIAIGLNVVYPRPLQLVRYAFHDPAMDLAAPFPSCDLAHASDIWNIPRGSKAYVQSQDLDDSGIACKPDARHPGPTPLIKFQRFMERLEGN